MKEAAVSESSAIPGPPAFVADILAGRPKGLNQFLARHGRELSEYVRALVGEDTRFDQVYEDVIIDILRQLRMAGSRANGGFRRFLFESAARTVRRRHSWVFDASRTSKPIKAPMRELARLAEPSATALAEAAKQLGPAERELLVLRFRFGFDYDEISDILKQARVAFEDQLMGAREHFRARLLATIGGGQGA